jgi:Flp pilus assembly CpaF family ATPase
VTTDFLLLRRLQHQLGTLRQQAVEDRRAHGLPALRGEDARQHGRSLVQRVVAGYAADRAEAGEPELCWEEQQDLILALEARLFGAGNLQQLLEDPDVEDIDINGFDTVFVGYADGSTRRHDPVFASNEDLVQTVQVLAGHEGLSSRPFDTANPRVNLRLPDGSRLYAVQGVTEAPTVSIRKHRVDVTGGLKSLVALASLDEELAEFLRAAVVARKNVMIAGETGSGKTTLLRAMAGEIDPRERIISVERSLELGLDKDTEAHPNAVAMEERLPNTEGLGAVSMADLVRDTLRLNPSRVIVGEVLGDEVVTMLWWSSARTGTTREASGTGCAGSWTVSARSTRWTRTTSC